MGRVKIRHYRIHKGRAFWEPTARMKALGFQSMPLDPPLDPPGSAPWATAHARGMGGCLDRHQARLRPVSEAEPPSKPAPTKKANGQHKQQVGNGASDGT